MALIQLFFFLFLLINAGFGQCKGDFVLKTNHVCNGRDTLTINSRDTLSQIQWISTNQYDTTVYAFSIPSTLDVKVVAGGNGLGSALNQFNNPNAIFIDKSGNLFVADQNNNRILKFPPGSSSLTNGVVVAGNNTNGGSGPADLSYPLSVYVDPAGNIYVADFQNGRVQKFPPNSKAGTPAVTVAQYGLDGPSYVTLDAAGYLYVADEAGEDIAKYPPNSNANTPCDTLARDLGYNISLFLAPSGDLYAAIADFYVVIKFLAGSGNPVLVAGGNGNGSGLNQLPGPIGCYVDASGNLFVVDAINCWILEFPPNSTGSSYGTIVAGGNGVRGGTLPNSLLDPTSLFLDNAGNIYVADDGNNRVNEYYKNGPRTSFIDTLYALAPPGPSIPCNFYAVVTNNQGCTDTTNIVTILPDNLPSISISSNAVDPNLCGQFTEPLTFTASIANGGSAPSYQWHLNGNAVGTNIPSYSGNFSNGDDIYCILTSNVSCATIPSVASSDFIVHFHTPPFATLTLAGGDCLGKDSLIVNPDIHSSATLNWMIAGNTDTTYKYYQVLDTGIASIGITVAGGNGGGNAFNQLHQPSSVCLDPSGNIYVADTRNNRVLSFPKGSNNFTNGVVVAGGNGDGINPDQLSSPTSVWVDPNGFLYVADADNYRIQRFNPGSTSASPGFTVAGGNGPGSNFNQFENPTTVCLDAGGNIYVCDELNNRIMEFPPNSNSQTNGSVVASVNDPYGMYVTPSGSIYISDLQNHEVRVFPPGNGTVVVTGMQGPSGNPLMPYGLFVDNQGDIFVADGGNNQVLEYTKSSAKGIVVAGANGKGSAANQLNEPYSICVDDSSNLYIVDFGNNRVQKYKHFITTIDTVFYPSREGVYSVLLTDTSGCTYTTNSINITKPSVPTVQIAASKTVICYGDPVDFIATASDTSKSPNYLWKLNTDSVGTNSDTFKTDSLHSGDSVYCIISNSDGCTASDTSNTLSFTVKPVPQLGPASGVTIPFGSSTTLNIQVPGDVTSYSWSPDYYLSADNILSPIASPRRSTTYYLTVVSAIDGCPATDSVTIEVTSKIHIPNAFTPNGDGINDAFYIMGGMPGDIIKDFSIFDRWGVRVFQNQNGIPNYTNYGWDGTVKGKPAATGTYVYVITIRSTDGEERVYKGTLVLIR